MGLAAFVYMYRIFSISQRAFALERREVLTSGNGLYILSCFGSWDDSTEPQGVCLGMERIELSMLLHGQSAGVEAVLLFHVSLADFLCGAAFIPYPAIPSYL
jgi:hypothetical protein